MSRASRSSQSLGAAAGLFLGPAAWIVNTQLGYALVASACDTSLPLVPIVALALAAAALAGASLSFRAWRHSIPEPEAQGGSPDRLLGGTGTLAGLLFALVILLQGSAGLLLDACTR
jgi:hypothetical protein